MNKKTTALARRNELETINAQQSAGQLVPREIAPIQVHIVQQPQPVHKPHTGPSTYETMQSKGEPDQLASMRLPGVLQLTISLIIITLFAFGASMLSIALTSYANSQDRIHNNRAPIHVR